MSIINQWINRYMFAGRESTADNAPTNEVVVDATGAMKTSLSGRNLISSGKKTDADGTDKTITTPGFDHVMLDCSDCTAEMTFTVDEAIAGAVKPVYVKAGATLDAPIKGATLHYSGAGTFRYILL